MNTLLSPRVLAATGHRPDKLGGYSIKTHNRLTQFAAEYLTVRDADVHHVISGMADGWDLAWADAAQKRGIPVHAAIPFPNQQARWSKEAQERYKVIYEKCDRYVVISDQFHSDAYQKRNRWMVDNCDELIALWNGSHGGTFNCVYYATKVPVINLWSQWSDFK